MEMLSGGDSDGEPPVPIPNTEVKPVSADGTWGGDPRESRTPPDTLLRTGVRCFESSRRLTPAFGFGYYAS